MDDLNLPADLGEWASLIAALGNVELTSKSSARKKCVQMLSEVLRKAEIM